MRGVLLGVLAGLLALAGGSPALAQGPPPALVRVDPVRVERLETWREATGEIRAVRRSVLAAEEEGLVLELAVREGQAIEAGQAVAHMDDTRAQLELRRTRAALRTAQAVVEERGALVDNARRDLERVRATFERGGGTEREIDQARTELRSTTARLEQARADAELAQVSVELATERLEDMAIEAPFAGRVVARRAEAGQWLSVGDPVAELVALDRVEAWIDVPERFIDRLRGEGERLRVHVPATGEERSVSSYTIVPDADPRSRLFPVRIVLDNPRERLKPGMGAIGLTPTGVVEPTPTVHKDALLRDDAGEFVFFAAPGQDGSFSAAPARVRRLFASGDRVAIRSAALPEGALVVVEGNERMYPGQPLNIQNLDDARPAQGASGSGGRGAEG